MRCNGTGLQGACEYDGSWQGFCYWHAKVRDGLITGYHASQAGPRDGLPRTGRSWKPVASRPLGKPSVPTLEGPAGEWYLLKRKVLLAKAEQGARDGRFVSADLLDTTLEASGYFHRSYTNWS